MRLLIACLSAAAVLPAQTPLSGEQALKRFKLRLDSLTAPLRVVASETAKPAKVCAIPLLMARVADRTDPGMVIVPRTGEHFQIRQVTPPAPACDGANVSWK
jgi:hypothetical protein